MFFVSCNQNILFDKNGSGYIFTFPLRFGYFFKSSKALKFSFLISAEFGISTKIPESLGMGTHYDFSLLFTMRTYKIYFGLGFFIANPFGERNSVDEPRYYYWYRSYGPVLTVGFLLTKLFYLGLNAKIYLVKYHEIESKTSGNKYTIKPVLIGF